MKKFLFFIMFFVLFGSNVKGEMVTLVSDRFEDVYANYYDVNLGRERYLESGRYSFNGNTAYCLEIGKPISSMVYDSSSSFDDINISGEDLDYIKIISYYGYDYPGHQTDKYYMATQELIWNRLISSSIKWTINLEPNNCIDVEEEKKEILRLYNLHYVKPSFDDEEVEVIKGLEKIITDDNNILDMYESTDENVVIDGNRLIVKKEFDRKEIVLKKKNYNTKSFLLYTSGISQKMLSVGGINTLSSKIKINLLSGSVTISKLDKENNSDIPMGEATLFGAKYGLYNEEDKLVDTFIIGKKNKIDNLAVGKYYVKEIEASKGYLLDKNIYEVEVNKDNFHINLTVYEEVIKRKIELFKVFASDETGLLVGEAGIKFDIYNKDGKIVTSIVTDNDGYAYVTLPYGTYIFKQVNSTKDYYKVEDFKVVVDKYDERPIYKLLSNSEIEARLKVIKKDLESGEVIVNSKARFKIFDVKNKKFVSFMLSYPEKKMAEEFELSDDGSFITPEALSPGEYILYEVDDYLDGYLYNSEGITFTVGEDSEIIDDTVYGPVIEISFYNKRAYGEVDILKYGEEIVYENNSYTYKNILLEGVKFNLYAKEDIFVNGKVIYEADDIVGTITTDNKGMGNLKKIPLGKYYLKEVASSNNNEVLDTIYDVNLDYKDQYTEKVKVSFTINNYLKKGKLIINKYDSITYDRLPNTLIEIRDSSDKVIYKGYTDSNGEIILNNIPYGEYYLSEIEASTGYKILDDRIYFTIDKDENIIDIYNERIDVPITGIDNSLINIISGIVIFVGIIIIWLFWKKKTIILGILFVLMGLSYYGGYFYKYYSDYYRNKESVTLFLDSNKIEQVKLDERYDYKWLLEIPSIGLERGITDINNSYNDVKYNIQLMKEDANHIILASHNGNGYNSYFRLLSSLELGDVIKLYDKEKVYEYIYSDNYVIEKTGMADIYTDDNKKAIVLITCSDYDTNGQNIYIGYLKDEYYY